MKRRNTQFSFPQPSPAPIPQLQEMETTLTPADYERMNREFYTKLKETGQAGSLRAKYSFKEKFGNIDEPQFGRLKPVVTDISGAVVSLVSYTGTVELFACSGTFLPDSGLSKYIVTSASLVRRDPYENTIAQNLKITVGLSGGDRFECSVECIDWHCNIAVLVCSQIQRPIYTRRPLFLDLSLPRSADTVIIALGRDMACEIMASCGKLVIKSSQKFQCQELMFSSATITKIGIGGPIIDEFGNWIGVSFFGDEETPFLPSFLDVEETPFLPSLTVLQCVEHMKIFGTVLHPWLGIRLTSIESLCLREYEKFVQKFNQPYGLMIDEVVQGSPAYEVGLRQGDVIIAVGEFHQPRYVAEFTEILLEATKGHLTKLGKTRPSDEPNDWEMLLNEIVILKSSGEYLCASIPVKALDPKRYNKWPVPKMTYLKVGGIGRLLYQ